MLTAFSRVRMKVFATLALGISLIFSCGKNEAREEESVESSAIVCEATEDCGENMICLAGKCASTRGSDIYTDPGAAVTPEKVGAELRAIQEKRQKRRDALLEGL